MVAEAVAITVAVAVAGWFLSPAIKKLIDKAGSYPFGKYKWRKDLPEKLDSVASFLLEIMGTVSLVEKQRIDDPSILSWLSQLKDAIEEVEDIFDVFDYEILKMSKHNDAIATVIRQPSSSCAQSRTELIGSGASFESLKKVLKKLDGIRQSSRGLVQASLLAAKAGCFVDGLSSSRSRSVTGPLLQHEKLFGYEDQYEELKKKLLEDGPCKSNRDARVVAIVGHGGMGKTTLARRAYNDLHVRGSFDLVIWAWVYNKLGAAELLSEIWKSATEARDAETNFASLVRNLKRLDISATWDSLTSAARRGEMSFGSIQLALEKLVTSKRFLLVLDDVCNYEMATQLQRRDTWSNVLSPFKHGKSGSRILLTTRATVCAETMGASTTIALDGIRPEQLILLLKRTAFGNENAHVPELQGIPESYVERLRGSPLAAKEIGLELTNNRDRKMWEEILKTECHENVALAHMSSYQHLPPHLKGCFAFCSIFPNGWKFDPEMLVKMWVAHGFVSDGLGGRSMEDVARRHFDELLSRSFFQAKKQGKVTHYVIHEHVHSMIRSVSAKYFFVIDGSRSTANIPSTVRHLSVTSACPEALDHLKTHPRLEKLRTLLIFNDPSSRLADIDDNILKQLKGVRVLDLSSTGITKLTKIIGELIHLRYLGLPNTMKSLPEKTGLLHLQTFGLRKNCQLDKLPDDMNSLVNLRHLDVDMKHIAKIGGIGTLRKLQGSVEFHAAEHNSIEELASMNSLSTLIIKGLNFVENKEDAQKAQLGRKESDKVLKLEWNPTVGSPSSLQDEVLEGLQPHSNIEELHIVTYHGVSSPRWLMDNLLQNLRHLHLINCRKWKNLPPLGQLRYLKRLHIKGMQSVFEINGCGLFESLEILELDDMPNLKQWTCESCDNTFPCVKKMKISNCPLLENPPPVPSSVRRMEITNTAQVSDKLKLSPSSRPNSCTLQVFGDILLHEGLLHKRHILATDNIFIRSLKREGIDPQIHLFTSVRELILENCSTKDNDLTRCLQELRFLSSLWLKQCAEIASFSFPERSEHLRVLKKLHIQNCGSISSLFGLGYCPALRFLFIEGCPLFTAASLPLNFGGLSCLVELRISNCSMFREIPECMPPCLESLKLKGCHSGLMKQLEDKTGVAWDRISSMPRTFSLYLD